MKKLIKKIAVIALGATLGCVVGAGISGLEQTVAYGENAVKSVQASLTEYTATVIYADGTREEVTYNEENRAEKLEQMAEKLSKDSAEYDYSNDLPEELPLENGKVYTETKQARVYPLIISTGKDREDVTQVQETELAYGSPFEMEPTKAGYTFVEWTDIDGNPIMTMPAKLTAIFAVWETIEYTATLIGIGGTENSVTYTVETRKDVLLQDAFDIPACDEVGYEYAWENLPEELPLENAEYKLIKRPVTYTVSFMVDGFVFATETYTVENKSITEPAAPEGYSWKEYTLDSGNKTVVAVKLPESPNTSDTTSENSGGDENSAVSSEGEQKKSGCKGAIGTVAVGIVALGLGAALLKKKED